MNDVTALNYNQQTTDNNVGGDSIQNISKLPALGENE